jgi:hydroxymethylglutaryl-CoA lyase
MAMTLPEPATALPSEVRIVEVGPRDGLQNEATPVATADKIAFIKHLAAAGLRDIEVTSFVHPKLVPQLADAAEVVQALHDASPSERHEGQKGVTGAEGVGGATISEGATGVTYSTLVPNERGLERALASGVKRIAVFTAASETFTQKNIGMSIDGSLEVFGRVIAQALAADVSVRAYLSTCFVCPFEGDIATAPVVELTERLLELGADEVAISDTIGAATPRRVFETVGAVLARVPAARIALHFHDTYGTALANVLAGLQLGVSTFDACTGGFGGCPFAPGAAGNLATEDLVYFLDDMGIESGVQLEGVISAAALLSRALGVTPRSRQWQRLRGATCGTSGRGSDEGSRDGASNSREDGACDSSGDSAGGDSTDAPTNH